MSFKAHDRGLLSSLLAVHCSKELLAKGWGVCDPCPNICFTQPFHLALTSFFLPRCRAIPTESTIAPKGKKFLWGCNKTTYLSSVPIHPPGAFLKAFKLLFFFLAFLMAPSLSQQLPGTFFLQKLAHSAALGAIRWASLW